MSNAKRKTTKSSANRTSDGARDTQTVSDDLHNAKRSLITVMSFLGLLTIFYAAFTFCADSWQITSAGLAAAALITIVAWLLSRRWPDQAVPSAAAAKFVGITSGIEGISITVAFILGAFDLWWLFLPLVLTSVSLHFTSMLIAYRRVVDWFIVPVTFAATALAWSAGTTDFFNTWAIAGGMLAGCCAGYALVLFLVLRKISASAQEDEA